MSTKTDMNWRGNKNSYSTNEMRALRYGKLLLVELYQKCYFDDDQFKSKNSIDEEFKKFIERNHVIIEPENQLKVCSLLKNFEFFEEQNEKSEFYKINIKNFLKFYNALVERLDKVQLENTNKRTKKRGENEFSSEELEKKFIADNSNEISLCFRDQVRQEIKKKFVFTETSCYFCQKHFSPELLPLHIQEHFKMRTHRRKGKGKGKGKTRNGENKNILKAFKITFRSSLIFPTLRFTLRNIRPSTFKNITIEKIMIIGERWMNFVMEEHLPLTIPSGAVIHFFIDSDFLIIKQRYPVFVFYTLEDNDITRFVEQFFFFKDDDYPLRNETMTANQENTMKFYKIDDFFPPKEIEELCSKKFITNDELIHINPNLKSYLDSDRTFNTYNINYIFEFFLQIEDATRSQRYQALSQTNCEINSTSKGYHLELTDLPENVNVKDILKPYDEIRMVGKSEEFSSIYIMGVIERIIDMDIFFTLRDATNDSNTEKELIKGKYDVTFFPNRTTFIIQYLILNKLSTFEDINGNIHYYQTLFPDPKIHMITETNNLSLNWFSENIQSNPEQMQAVENIVKGTHDSIPYIIFGPPGTGKTTTIVEAILQLWKTNPQNKILVTAGSNAACDEIGVRLRKQLLQIDPTNTKAMLRIYAQSVEKRIDTLNEDLKYVSNLADNRHFYPSLKILKEYSIIIATSMVAGKFVSGNMESGFFTHIIIDECAASTEPEALIPIVGLMAPTTKLILSGDPKQLGPVLENRTISEMGLGVSLIERLLNRKCYEVDKLTGHYNKLIQTRLIKNYRTHSDILYLSNSLYYDNELKACASEDITHWGLNWYKLPSKKFPIVFDVVNGETIKDDRSASLYNELEIKSVLRYVQEILFFGINDREMTEFDIGIISPYKKQINLIRSELDRRGWFKIETGSVETFQGKEKPVIIVSTVRSNTKGIGFLDSPKRINVTLTRAQALLIIIGNPDTLQLSSDWRKVIEYCRKNNSMLEYQITKKVLSSSPETVDITMLNHYFKNLNI